MRCDPFICLKCGESLSGWYHVCRKASPIAALKQKVITKVTALCKWIRDKLVAEIKELP